MSRRHSPVLTALSGPEVRAHARADRQRVRSSLGMLVVVDHDDDYSPDEPWLSFRAPRHRDPEGVRTHGRDHERHWKQPFWKRRTTSRRDRVLAELALHSA